MALLHKGDGVLDAQGQVAEMIRQLLVDANQARDVRDDVDAGELATFCVNALSAGAEMADEDAVRRLLGVTLDGLRPPA